MRSVPRLPRWSLTLALGLAALPALLGGCDSTPGTLPVETTLAPQVSDLTVTPEVVQFEEVFSDGQTATFTITATAEVTGDVSEIRFLVQPQASFDPVAEVVADGGAGRVEGRLEVTLPRDQTGLLSVLAVALGPDGRTANEARATVLVERPNEPPVIDAIDAPDTFSPPGLLRFDVTATDPDGPSDIVTVEVITPAGDRLDLFLQSDGRYAATFDVPDAEPGPQTFTFFATDRAGAESARVDFTVTITE